MRDDAPPVITRRLPLAGGGDAVLALTTRVLGDLAVDGDPAVLATRRARLTTQPWTWLRQVHGAQIVVVDAPGQHAGREADAAVTVAAGSPVAAHAADCALVALVGHGAVGVVHAGWRGLVAGVMGGAVAAMRMLDGTTPVAVLGPCIRPADYQFGEEDLAHVVAVLGEEVRGRTRRGRPALDVPAAVRAALLGAGIDRCEDLGYSTADADLWFSHRLRHERGRHALVAWIER